MIMVPPAYGEVAGKAAGLEEFYVRPDLQLRRGETWADSAVVDRMVRSGELVCESDTIFTGVGIRVRSFHLRIE